MLWRRAVTGLDEVGGATVRNLDARPVADTATEELREAIFRGEHLPGEIISLHELAERARCRLPVLLAYVRRLEDDGLIVIHHDVAMVQPLDADELRWAWHTTARLTSVIAERVVTRLTDADLDRLQDCYPTTSVDSPTFHKDLSDSSFRRSEFITSRVATRIDQLMAQPIVQIMKRHYGPLALGPAMPRELLHTRADAEREINTRYRARRKQAVLDSATRSWEASEIVGHLLIEQLADQETKREHARIIQLRR